MTASSAKALDFSAFSSSIAEIIAEARAGKIFILVDDEDRENEGDLVIPAQMATPEAINFMARFGRGLICLALTSDRVSELGLSLMERRNESRLSTAFTVSIEARDGITTGISAADRARTIAVAVDPKASSADIVTPGHVFPLVAREGGTLIRAGHTEAAVDIARLAGLYPAGVICEIMNEDGTMARRDDLIAFAQLHNLKIATIASLIEHRRRTEKLVHRVAESHFISRFGGEFQLLAYRNSITGAEHLALVKGDLSGADPVLVRVHAFDPLHDALGGLFSNYNSELESALNVISEEGRGVVVLICNPDSTRFAERLAKSLDENGGGQAQKGEKPLRDYGEGAQILLDLGVTDMELLHNTRHSIIGLEGYGLTVKGQRPLIKTTA